MPVVLILGATSDMAMAIARKFASHHYDIQLAARKPEQLKPLQSDIRIRYNVGCSLHAFDALNYSTHQQFVDELQPKPDVAISVFGYLGDANKARNDWQEANIIVQSNYTGAVSILDKIAKYFESE